MWYGLDSDSVDLGVSVNPFGQTAYRAIAMLMDILPGERLNLFIDKDGGLSFMTKPVISKYHDVKLECVLC
jgi:hypothetical protein